MLVSFIKIETSEKKLEAHGIVQLRFVHFVKCTFNLKKKQ